MVGWWRGYLSGARCRLAYGPTGAAATHCLLLQYNRDWFYLSGTGSKEKGPLNVCVCVCVSKRPQCGPVRRYKDTVKTNMKRCSPRPKSLSTAPFDRAPPHASRPPRHSRSRGLPSWTGNGQLASSRSSTPPARFGRATDAAGPAHHGLRSSPIGVPIHR